MNLDLICENTFSHQRQMLADAAQRRIVSRAAASRAPARTTAGLIRRRLALLLRRAADWLEPAAQQPRIRLLRALAHREIDVDQAMQLLNRFNGHYSGPF